VPYHERLNELGLWSVEERRNRTDMVEVFKAMKGLSNIRSDQFFELVKSYRTRGHLLRIVKKRFSTTMRQFSFSQRVMTRWNSLDEKAVSSRDSLKYKEENDGPIYGLIRLASGLCPIGYSCTW